MLLEIVRDRGRVVDDPVAVDDDRYPPRIRLRQLSLFGESPRYGLDHETLVGQRHSRAPAERAETPIRLGACQIIKGDRHCDPSVINFAGVLLDVDHRQVRRQGERHSGIVQKARPRTSEHGLSQVSELPMFMGSVRGLSGRPGLTTSVQPEPRTRAAGTRKLPAISFSRSSSLARCAARNAWIAAPAAVSFQNQSPSWRLDGLAVPASPASR